MSIQQTIIEGLKLQLTLHDYIVLPGFGGFVLKHRSAHFNAGGTGLFPPSKSVTFNAQLRQNDGILATWLCKKTGCNAAEAEKNLADFSGYCLGVLGGHRRLSLPGIGFFYLDFENNLCFDPQADQNFLAESFGLQPVITGGVKREPSRKSVFEDRKIVPATRPGTARERMRRAALPAMLFLFTAMFTVMIVSVSEFRGELRAALGGSGSQGAYRAANYPGISLKTLPAPRPLVTDANGIARLSIGKADLPVKVGNSETGYAAGKNVSSRYQIILGCFAVPSNARKLVRQLEKENIVAHISPVRHRGMLVVVAGAYADRNAALADLPAVRKTIPAAWIKSVR